MNQAEAKDLIIDVLAGIAPEADFAALPGKAQLRDELDLDSMDFLNFVAALHERTTHRHPGGRLSEALHLGWCGRLSLPLTPSGSWMQSFCAHVANAPKSLRT